VDLPPVVVAPTVTKLPPDMVGAVLVTGSHGGHYAAALAAASGARAVIFHDAGVGRDRAAIAALDLFAAQGVAVATVAHTTARVGDAADMMVRGRISHANAQAAALGVHPGMPCAEAAGRLRHAPPLTAHLAKPTEARFVWRPEGAQRDLVLIDSAALADPVADRGTVVVAGSHGGLIGGRAEMALRTDAYAACFHDAGIGIDAAGIGRLPALAARGIAAITVAADSARIGQARSLFEDGTVSAVNTIAEAWGACPGERARDRLLAWTRRAG
jgi:hypothetical protein